MPVIGFDLTKTSRAPGWRPEAGDPHDALWLQRAATMSVAPATGGAATSAAAGTIFDAAQGSLDIRSVGFSGGGGTVAGRNGGSAASLDWADGGQSATLTLDLAWNTIKNAAVHTFTGTTLTLANWVDVWVALDNDFGQRIVIDGAKRGEVTTGAGDDVVEFGVDSNDTGWTNHVRISTGAGDDTVTVGGASRDWSDASFGKRGYDPRWTVSEIDAGTGDDRVRGGDGTDRIVLGDGDDWAQGNGGNDTIWGGAGWDVAAYAGAAEDYEIVAVAGGGWTVRDRRPDRAGDEGTDTIYGIEALSFADRLVRLVNAAPDAADDAFDAIAGSPVLGTVLANDTDAEGDALSASLLDGPSHGTLSFNADGTFTYVAVAGFAGEDRFTYRVDDGFGGSDTATVVLRVAPGNRAPDATDDAFDAVAGMPFAGSVVGNDTDPDGDALAVALVEGPSHGTLTLGADGSFTYLADPAYAGADAFTYRVTDAAGLSDTATVRLSVARGNAAPDAVDDAFVANAGLPIAGEVLANDADPDGDALTAALVQGPTHGSLSFGPDGAFTYVAMPGFAGEDVFTYRVTDPAGASDVATVRLTVRPENRAPVAADDSYEVNEDRTLTVGGEGVLRNDADPDGDPLALALLVGPLNGTLALEADGTFVYVPFADFHGQDSFTYRVSDAAGLSDTATVTIRVRPVNDAPTVGAESYAMAEDGRLIVAAADGVLANDVDPDGNPITATVVEGPAHGTLVLGADGSFTYVPDDDFAGTDSFVYAATDGSLATPSTVTIEIAAVDDAPRGLRDAFTLAEDSTFVAPRSVLANDSDAEGDAMVAELVGGPAHGTLDFAADGTFVYRPNADFFGRDSFTYRPVANGVAGDVVTVDLTVSNTDDPVTPVDETYGAFRNQALVVDAPLGLLANDITPDGSPRTVQGTFATAAGGTIAVNRNGGFTYTPAWNFTGTDRFTYQVGDALGSTAPATVTFDVRRDPNAILSVDLADVALGFGGVRILGTQTGGQFGGAVAGLGDVNGDGFADVAIGAPGAAANGSNAGAVYVVWGGSGLAPRLASEIAAGTGGFVITSQAAGDQAGLSVEAAGDLNGDGLADILIGAPGNDAGGSGAGAAYLVHGKADGGAVALASVAAGIGGARWTGVAAGDAAGHAVARLGDVTGDGVVDVAVGARANDAAGADAGVVYVLPGNAASGSLAAAAAFRILGEAAGDAAGYAVAGAGDVNGDGIADIVLGANGNDAGGSNAGAAYVVFGREDGGDVSLAALGADGFRIVGEALNDRAGWRVGALGDLNGDGMSEIMLTAPRNYAGGAQSGAAYVIFGKPDSEEVDLDAVALGVGGFRVFGERAGDQAATSLAALGDVNGDGFADFAVGAPFADPSGANSGAAYVVFGRPDLQGVNLDAVALGEGGFRIVGETSGDQSGISVANAGDVNGDGFTDLIVGATLVNNGNFDTGAAYIVFGSADWAL